MATGGCVAARERDIKQEYGSRNGAKGEAFFAAAAPEIARRGFQLPQTSFTILPPVVCVRRPRRGR
jgi:hypothetical protein